MQYHFKPSSPRWTQIYHWVIPSALRCLCKQKLYLFAVWVSSCTGTGPIFKTCRMCDFMSKKNAGGYLPPDSGMACGPLTGVSTSLFLHETFVAFTWLFLGWRKPRHFKLFLWEFWLNFLPACVPFLGVMCNVLLSFAYQVSDVHIIFTFSFEGNKYSNSNLTDKPLCCTKIWEEHKHTWRSVMKQHVDIQLLAFCIPLEFLLTF